MNNKLFFDFISVVEKVLHLIILGMVIFLCFEEVISAVNGGGAVSYTHLRAHET